MVVIHFNINMVEDVASWFGHLITLGWGIHLPNMETARKQKEKPYGIFS